MKTIRVACTVMRSDSGGHAEIESVDDGSLHIKLRASDLARDIARSSQDAPGVSDPWSGDLVVSFELPDSVPGSFARSERRAQVLTRLARLTDDQIEKIGAAIDALDPSNDERDSD